MISNDPQKSRSSIDRSLFLEKLNAKKTRTQKTLTSSFMTIYNDQTKLTLLINSSEFWSGQKY